VFFLGFGLKMGLLDEEIEELVTRYLSLLFIGLCDEIPPPPQPPLFKEFENLITFQE
jgi:hypothetical protein